ncbi:hypothetical protein ANCCEY_11917 [Ancylostoma ceylanicum]|uniref:Tetratricopeptide repeat protein 38 n=1 Tax=Ancylostoma ceylanicum TaxID=53326 RepID=A0A0D6LGE9_9BILA|nr:hypothetical protein ANCCEY_11917 [Ancylostoma ceylanicum]
MKAADPKAVLPRAFRLGLEGLGTSTCTRVNETLKTGLEQLQEDAKEYGNTREQKHAKAVLLWCEGKMRAAADIWEDILVEYPTDLMAIKFAHEAYFFMGDAKGKRDSVQAVLPKHKGTEPCYRHDSGKMNGFSYLHGMWAFGLEECEQYDQAEKEAVKALNLNRFDCWATHARAHCMVMQGRIDEGINFMESTVDDWRELPSKDEETLIQKKIYMKLCLIFQSKNTDVDNAKVCRDVGIALYEGMQHYGKGQYDEAAEKMLPVRHEVYRIGGSNAQRDIFAQTLIQACIMSKDPEHFKQTNTLLDERSALNKNSSIGERLAAKFRKYHSM